MPFGVIVVRLFVVVVVVVIFVVVKFGVVFFLLLYCFAVFFVGSFAVTNVTFFCPLCRVMSPSL